MKTIFALIGLLVCTAVHAETMPWTLPAERVSANDASANRCQLMGKLFWHVAYERDGGQDARTAAFSTSQWLGQNGEMGHMKSDLRPAVASATDFVFRHKESSPNGLYHYGRRSCELMETFRAEPPRAQAALMLLGDAAADCSQRHPSKTEVGPIRECMADRSKAITERVRKARIESK